MILEPDPHNNSSRRVLDLYRSTDLLNCWICRVSWISSILSCSISLLETSKSSPCQWIQHTHTLQASLHCQLGLWKVCGVISQGDNKYMYNVIDNDLVVDYSPSSRDPLGQSSLSAGTHPVLVLGRDNGRASGFPEPCSVHTGSMSSASHFLLHTWDMYNTILISTTL